MQDWFIQLNSSLPVNLVGRKAAALGQLIEAGFPVPSGVCITTQTFQAAKGSDELALPEGMLESLSRMIPLDTPLAVRSSAVEEDRPEASLAGRYPTQLNVTGAAALEHAVLECWRSYFDAPATGGDGGMAVLIQPLLEAECAGVCFTVDPVRRKSELLLVVSGWGQGAGVVGGSIPTDTIRMRRFDLRAEEISIADKHTAVHPAETGGLTHVPVSRELRTIPCLPDDGLRRIGEFGLASDIDLLVLLSTPFDYFVELRQIVDLLYPIQLESEQLISAKPASASDMK